MFIRKTIKTDPVSGKKYFSYQLVESFRTENGPRQKILLTIGTDTDLNDSERKLLANRIEEIISGAQSIFPYPDIVESLAQHHAKLFLLKNKQISTLPESENKESNDETDYRCIDINSLKHNNIRSVGCEHVLYSAYKQLGFNTLFAKFGFSKKQQERAAAAIIGRAAHPSSEKALHQWLLSKSALDEILGTSFTKLSIHNLYFAADDIFQHKKTIEKHLRVVEKNLFNLEETIILYDMTNTFFEGACKGHPKAKRGKSKEKRSDCPLLSLGVILDSDGFPKHSEIFPGNVNERTTLQEMIIRLNRHKASESPIIVLDSGIATKDNIKWLKESNYTYIVMMKKKLRPQVSETKNVIINDKNGQLITGSLVFDQETGDNLLLCYSEQRQKKELDIKQHQLAKLELALATIKKSLSTKRYNKVEIVQRKIGRLRERHPRLSQHYVIEVHSKDQKSVDDVTWVLDHSKIDKSFSGTYSLRTNIKDCSPEILWHIYMMLSEAEACFRCLKSEAGLRPNFHFREDRMDSHIFLSVLAYHLIASIRKKLRGHGIHDSWTTIREALQSHCVLTTIGKTKEGDTINLRSSSEPNEYQKEIYRALGIGFKPVRTEKRIISKGNVVSKIC